MAWQTIQSCLCAFWQKRGQVQAQQCFKMQVHTSPSLRMLLHQKEAWMEPPMVQSALHALPRPHRVSFEEFRARVGFIVPMLATWVMA